MARQASVPEQVRQFLAMIDPRPDGIIVALSGGADSVALLRALHDVAAGRLVVAHINHGLRGVESDADERFVGQLAESLEVPFRTVRRDLPSEARGRNLEATARAARYAWLALTAREEKIRLVATGHSADDLAETVLMNLIRGSGLHGVRGMARQRKLSDGVQLIRPLLRIGRPELRSYLQSLTQPWREDSSNWDRRFLRNRIRHDLLPHLAEQYNPRVSEALARFGDQADHWRRRQQAMTRRHVAAAELPRAGAFLVFDRGRIEGMSERKLADCWHWLWQREEWPTQAMGFREFERIARWCRSPAAALELPGGIRLTRRERTIVAGPIGQQEGPHG